MSKIDLSKPFTEAEKAEWDKKRKSFTVLGLGLDSFDMMPFTPEQKAKLMNAGRESFWSGPRKWFFTGYITATAVAILWILGTSLI